MYKDKGASLLDAESKHSDEPPMMRRTSARLSARNITVEELGPVDLQVNYIVVVVRNFIYFDNLFIIIVERSNSR
jgi:hypothetical protein